MERTSQRTTPRILPTTRTVGLLSLLVLALWLLAAPSSPPVSREGRAASNDSRAPRLAGTSRLTDRSAPRTYENPLVRNVADPFVLKYRGEYYLYRTEVHRALDVLTSRDLVHWRQGPVIWKPLSPTAENASTLWAPEVYHENGKFYLYFSAGSGGRQQLWLAVADSPLGPFRTDPGGPLTAPWRIDGSMFRDEDGTRYLYCCHRWPGDSARVEGRRLAAPTDRSDAGWQPMVSPVAPWEGIWVEGPTLLRDASGYYLLYSGPGAMLPTYQVGYATAPTPLGPWKKQGLLIPTVTGVPGPGHQSVVLAPDNLTPYLVYHRKRLAEPGWDRDLMLDRLAMGGGRLTTRAPTMTPQPMPPRPAFEDHFDRTASLGSWALTAGNWRVDGAAHEMVQASPLASGRARLTTRQIADGVVEVNVRRLSDAGGAGLALTAGSSRFPALLFAGGPGLAEVGPMRGHRLPEELDPRASHQLLVTRRGDQVEVRIDGRRLGKQPFTAGPATLELTTERSAAAFSGIAVTDYTEPLPLGPPEPPSLHGWRRVGDQIEQRLLGAQLQLYPLAKPLPDPGMLTVRVRGWALGATSGYPKYGVRVRAANGAGQIEAYIDPATGVLATHGRVGGRELPWQNSVLPLRFDYTDWHELTLARRGDRWQFAVDGGSAQERSAALHPPLLPALVTEDARAAFRGVMVRSR
jgi:GH43 family beta-xylosidase